MIKSVETRRKRRVFLLFMQKKSYFFEKTAFLLLKKNFLCAILYSAMCEYSRARAIQNTKNNKIFWRNLQ